MPQMRRPPFESIAEEAEKVEQVEERISRPMPCPECFSTKGYIRRSPALVHCKNCNSLIKAEAVDMQLISKETNK